MARTPVCRVAGCLLLACLIGCSPMYVIRAGWEEAGILLRRQDIRELLEDSQIEPSLRETFEYVLGARAFAEEIGLKPKGSFTQYSEIDREVLVWVLSASPKDALSFTTWWFPIVGRVPYKGFFEKEDGIEEAKALQEDGQDIFLRPSVAFSTLGWFNDPLLSTMKDFDKVSLVNTVIHEILHNTVWIPGDVTFNETMANVVGAVGAIQYFEKTSGTESELAQIAQNRWHDEQRYAVFVRELFEELESFYKTSKQDNTPRDQVLKRRDEIFASAGARWNAQAAELRTNRYQTVVSKWNNAVILAQTIYLDRLPLFVQLLELCNQSLPCFVEEAERIRVDARSKRASAYDLLLQRLEQLKKQAAPASDLASKAVPQLNFTNVE